jgi:hypothetical protein
MDRIRNEYIRGRLKVAPVTQKIRSNKLAWAYYAERRKSHTEKSDEYECRWAS